MDRFNFFKVLSQTGDSLKHLSDLNPLTIHKKGTKAKAFFALSMVCFFWGTTWIASREGVKDNNMPALQMAGMRQLMGGSCFLIYYLYKGERWPRGKEWRPIIILSFLNFFLSNGLSTWGVKYISAGLGAIIGAIFPIWLVIIGLFMKGDKMPSRAIIGMIIGFGGICITFYEHLKDFLNPDFLFGIIVSLIATWSWAFGTLYTKSQAANFNPYFSLGLQMVISAISLITITEVTGVAIPINAIPWQTWAAMSYLMIFGSTLSFIAYIYALKNLRTEQVSIYAYINPMVALLLGAILFKEKITVFIVIGGLVALLGVYLVNRSFKAIPPSEQPEPEGV